MSQDSMKKKQGLELKKKIKELEAKKREQTMEQNPVKVIKGDDAKPKISFDQWWMMAAKSPKLKSWMKEVVWADFKARGLTKDEPKDKYDDGLRLFGVTL